MTPTASAASEAAELRAYADELMRQEPPRKALADSARRRAFLLETRGTEKEATPSR